MKNIVVSDEYKEIDLKPSQLLRRYIDLTRRDVRERLVKKKQLKEYACPACRGRNVASHFEKFGLHYKECDKCFTLYISPRPDDRLLNDYYRSAGAAVFWREQLSQRTDQKRREKIVKPRFQWILESTDEYNPSASHFVDFNTNQYGYVEEILKTDRFKQKTLIDPFVKPEDMPKNSRLNVIHSPWWELHEKENADVVSLFEVSDRTSDIDRLFKTVHRMLKPRGLCFLTAILVSGFDLQVLWDKAENLYPPDRLNVFSIEGLRLLFDRHGFECLELSTPGVLDVEIVTKAVAGDPGISMPRFIKYLLQNKNTEAKKAFQGFLQENLLSSYGRIVIRKK